MMCTPYAVYLTPYAVYLTPYAVYLTPYAVYLIERCFLSMIAFKLTTRLKGKGPPTKAFGTCGKYCFRSINEVRVGGAGP